MDPRPKVRAQEPDSRQLSRLLRARGKRPRGRRATEKRDELAPSHYRPEAQDTVAYLLTLLT